MIANPESLHSFTLYLANKFRTKNNQSVEGGIVEKDADWSFSFSYQLEKKIGVLPCRSSGSNGRIPWRTFRQDRILDAGLHQRLPGPNGLQETSGTTFGFGSRPEELEEILETPYLAMVETVAESQASPQRHSYRGRACCKCFNRMLLILHTAHTSTKKILAWEFFLIMSRNNYRSVVCVFKRSKDFRFYVHRIRYYSRFRSLWIILSWRSIEYIQENHGKIKIRKC